MHKNNCNANAGNGNGGNGETVTADRAKMVRTPQAVSHVLTILEQSPAVMDVHESPKNVR